MKIIHTMIIMFIGSFLIQYFVMSNIMVNERIHITNNIGKAYMALIMALLAAFLEVMMYDQQYKIVSVNLYLILLCLLIFFIYLYRKQIAITDKQYLQNMIEHHSMGIFTSEEILKKTNDYNVTRLAKNIISKQQDEIKDMEKMLKK